MSKKFGYATARQFLPYAVTVADNRAVLIQGRRYQLLGMGFLRKLPSDKQLGALGPNIQRDEREGVREVWLYKDGSRPDEDPQGYLKRLGALCRFDVSICCDLETRWETWNIMKKLPRDIAYRLIRQGGFYASELPTEDDLARWGKNL